MAQQITRFVNPVLAALKQLGNSGRPAEVCTAVAHDMELDGPVLEKTLNTGVSWFYNTIGRVRHYLVLGGYVDGSERGVWRLTKKGRNSKLFSDDEANEFVLKMHRLHRQRLGDNVSDAAKDEAEEEDDDSSDVAREEPRYKTQLLERIRALSPKGFEQLSQRLLRESGFEEVDVTGRPGDGGIDGIGVLRVNAFVAFKVLFQCKRYSGVVAANDVCNFHGAMQGRADKGIILTTGTFSAAAMKEAVRDGAPPIELVDGARLVGLFEELAGAVDEWALVPIKTYEVNPAFFSQFDSDNDNSSP